MSSISFISEDIEVQGNMVAISPDSIQFVFDPAWIQPTGSVNATSLSSVTMGMSNISGNMWIGDYFTVHGPPLNVPVPPERPEPLMVPKDPLCLADIAGISIANGPDGPFFEVSCPDYLRTMYSEEILERIPETREYYERWRREFSRDSKD